MPRQTKFEIKVAVTGNRRHANNVHAAIEKLIGRMSAEDKADAKISEVKTLKKK